MIYFQLFITFLKIGLFTFGGGYAMIPLIQQEVVGNQWMTMNELSEAIAIAQSTPGAFAVNAATFVGMESGGFLGAFITASAVILASFSVILIIAKCFTNFLDSRWVKGLLFGMKPVVIGLIASAVVLLMYNGFLDQGVEINSITAFLEAIQFRDIIIFVIGAVFYFRFKPHPIKLILLSGGLGILLFGIIPLLF
ncbi:chromate transporter [Acetobacterium fimetarium]|uniref:Chromate transporter n=1 Tax=Acetobacterium fimetarium TaxID=52691 RepID=A0ABR6WV97_9FIRM|nr:chromate transporter [Acetobacterium fimetarium]MBC3804547.1 chromate transporter [Acetobacterium fimetarium]